MSYATATDLDGLIPPEWRVASTDDDGGTNGEAIAAVLSSAEDEINGILSTRYKVPVNLEAENAPVPLLKHCCRYIAAELCYGRRGLQDQFPFKPITEQIRLTLRQIAQGKIPLFPDAEQVSDEAVAITEKSRVHSSRISF